MGLEEGPRQREYAEEGGRCGAFREQLPIVEIAAVHGGARTLRLQARPCLLTGTAGTMDLTAKQGAAPVLWPISETPSDLRKS